MSSLAYFKYFVEQRLFDHPDNVYYRAGKAQLAIIESEIARTGRLSRATYGRLTLGIMCAREVEQIDMKFCHAAYAMLEEVRPRA